MLIVLFAGVIAFCRQSKKGAVVFSGLGFAIFIVGWLLLAAIFPASMVYNLHFFWFSLSKIYSKIIYVCIFKGRNFNFSFFFFFKAFVDFCTDGTQFIREYMSNETMTLFEFYRKCNPAINHDNMPSVIRIDKISKQLSDIREMSQKFDPKIDALFNSSRETIKVAN